MKKVKPKVMNLRVHWTVHAYSHFKDIQRGEENCCLHTGKLSRHKQGLPIKVDMK